MHTDRNGTENMEKANIGAYKTPGVLKARYNLIQKWPLNYTIDPYTSYFN